MFTWYSPSLVISISLSMLSAVNGPFISSVFMFFTVYSYPDYFSGFLARYLLLLLLVFLLVLASFFLRCRLLLGLVLFLFLLLLLVFLVLCCLLVLLLGLHILMSILLFLFLLVWLCILILLLLFRMCMFFRIIGFSSSLFSMWPPLAFTYSFSASLLFVDIVTFTLAGSPVFFYFVPSVFWFFWF